MTRRGKRQLVRVSRRHPCPICGRPDWCGVSADGEIAICMRVESDRPTRNDGWLHVLVGDDVSRHPPPPPPRVTPAPPAQQDVDWAALLARWGASTSEGALEAHAGCLGVTAVSLARMGAVWAPSHRAWAYPMRDGEGAIIGVRLRSPSGGKWAIKGSRQGLFMPDGCIGALVEDLVICEGPTDAAALLDLGCSVVGRPSCTGGADMLEVVCHRRNVVIVADNDPPKTRPDGSSWRPGWDGATSLADRLVASARTVKVIKALVGTDVRDWWTSGKLTHEVLDIVTHNARFWRRRRQSG